MVCWSITSTVAGISRTVRSSRLALEATPLVFNGDGPRAELCVGTGTAGLAAARCTARPDTWVRFESDCTRLTGLRFGSLTITGPIWPGCSAGGGAACAHTGAAAAGSDATKATDADAKCAHENVGTKRR